MAQSALANSSAAAMASTLMELNSADITVEHLGLLDTGEALVGPFQRGRKIIVDLSPEEDTWLDVDEVNTAVLPHHEGQEAEALHLAVHLNTAESFKLEAIEKKIQKAYGYSVIQNLGKTWYPMQLGEGKVVRNVVLEHSKSPTLLRFIQAGVMKKGVGKAFLEECLAGAKLTDFHCKVKMELDFLHVTAESINVTLTAHSIAFIPMLKRTVVDFTAEEDETMMRSSKRRKFMF